MNAASPDMIAPELLCGHPRLYRLLLSRAAELNAELQQQYLAVRDRPATRRTHHVHGRFENTYVPRELVPAIETVLSVALDAARSILGLGQRPLRIGFWFNEMWPGSRTSLHSHEEDDEQLSAVYYVAAPPAAGDFVLFEDDHRFQISPVAGALLLFPPHLPHQVEPHNGEGLRLSVAMNIGPADRNDPA